MMQLEELRAIDEPIPLEQITARAFFGDSNDNDTDVREGRITNEELLGENVTIGLDENNNIVKIDDPSDEETESKLILPSKVLLLPGQLNLHGHSRDCYDILPCDEGAQLHKENAYTFALAMAQGGAIFAMTMPNVANEICSAAQLDAQLHWLNTARSFREKPIMEIGQYMLIKKGTKPLEPGANVMYKLMWNTFGPANLASDDEVEEVLKEYGQEKRTDPLRWVTAHCETITDIVDKSALPWHEQRPRQGCINATKLFLSLAKKYRFHAHVAHVATHEEVDMIDQYNKANNKDGLYATCEITPQAATLNVDTFEEKTGLDIKWAQQNPAMPNEYTMDELRKRLGQDKIKIWAGDHAPHKKEEKIKGMSGTTQAPTEGQVLLDLIQEGVITLKDVIRLRSTNPGNIVEQELGLKYGRIQEGYRGCFTLVNLGTPSRITDADVASKCGWTPYANREFKNTIEGVVIDGTLYTQAAIQKLREN